VTQDPGQKIQDFDSLGLKIVILYFLTPSPTDIAYKFLPPSPTALKNFSVVTDSDSKN
jgi:hypothetical protein